MKTFYFSNCQQTVEPFYVLLYAFGAATEMYPLFSAQIKRTNTEL